WKFPVSTRRIDHFEVSAKENPVQYKTGEGAVAWMYTTPWRSGFPVHNESREFMLELALCGTSVASGVMLKRDNNNR
ncbi:hypothetical protein PFISCL1PPCAC_3863, partial [Pristionchus fissidentatus]